MKTKLTDIAGNNHFDVIFFILRLPIEEWHEQEYINMKTVTYVTKATTTST